MLVSEGVLPIIALGELITMVDEADIIAAHNKKFDQTIFDCTLKKFNLPERNKRWLCTLTEVPYPDNFSCKKLSHLAWEHGLDVDRSKLHRADYDVKLMLNLLALYNLPEVLKYADEPWVYLQASIAKPWEDNGVGKAKAQKLGFGWQKARGDDKEFLGTWVKRVKQRFLDEELEKARAIGLKLK